LFNWLEPWRVCFVPERTWQILVSVIQHLSDVHCFIYIYYIYKHSSFHCEVLISVAIIGVRFMAGARNSLLHIGSGAHPASHIISIGDYFPGGKAAGAWSWPHPHLMLRLRVLVIYLYSPVGLQGAVCN
jgi:hypothetical protein